MLTDFMCYSESGVNFGTLQLKANIILHLVKLMISVLRTHGVDFLLVLSLSPVTKGDSSGE